ncbi:MAG: ROK family protein [Opitutales bacterium]|nr:ROK family protein [Opitutales bacterium]
MDVLGIDIGGTGIKAAVVDTLSGDLVSERVRVPTELPVTRTALLRTLGALLDQFDWRGPVGCGFPGVIRGGCVDTAANLGPDLPGWDLKGALREHHGIAAYILNDADAAALAEAAFGAARGQCGVVLVLTVGTGIGSALVVDGVLVPNIELGHAEYKGKVAEHFVSNRTRKAEELSWKQWAQRFDGFLRHLERIIQPDLFVIGGGGAKKPKKFAEFLRVKTPVRFAAYANRAGIIGAAVGAARAETAGTGRGAG